MAQGGVIPFGQAPWEQGQAMPSAGIIPFGKAPWEQASAPAPQSLSSLDDRTISEGVAKAAKDLNDSGNASNNALFNTLTLGHLPQIKAKIEQLLSGHGIANDETYVNLRDHEIAKMSDLAEKYPLANIEGKTLGFAAPMIATAGGSAVAEGAAPLLTGAAESTPELAAAAKAGALKTIAKAALKGAGVGAVMGAAQNPGDQPGVVDPLQVSERLQNAKTGAEIGGVIGGAGGGISKAADSLSQYAEKKALKGAGFMLKDMRKEYSKGTIQDTGRFILNHDLVKTGDTFADVAKKASDLQESTGQQLGAGYEASAKILSNLDPSAAEKVNAAGFNPVRDKSEILKAVKDKLGYAFRGNQALKAVSDYLDQLASEHGDITFNPQQTNQIKTALDQTAISWERNPLAREPDTEAALKTLRTILNKKVSGQIQALGEAIGKPDAAEALANLNNKYGMAAKVARVAADKANREAANRAIGLTDTISGGAGAAIGAALGGPGGAVIGDLAGIGLNKAARSYGAQAMAQGADMAAGALSRVPNPTAIQQANPALYSGLTQSGDFSNIAPKLAPISAPVSAPQKGHDKWANDGFQKLKAHSDAEDKATLDKFKGALMADPKTRDLLVAASNYSPGSKALEKIMSRIKAKAGK